MLAFELADKYRNPAIVLTDGFVGQMMEPLDLEYREIVAPPKTVGGAGNRRHAPEHGQLDLSRGRRSGRASAQAWKRNTCAPRTDETRCEEYRTDDAELLVVGYGIVSRVLRSAVDEARKQGIKVGLFRPITLWPFPTNELAAAALRAEKVSGRRTEQRADGGRRPAGARRASVRSSSTDASAATCPASKNCWRRSKSTCRQQCEHGIGVLACGSPNTYAA